MALRVFVGSVEIWLVFFFREFGRFSGGCWGGKWCVNVSVTMGLGVRPLVCEFGIHVQFFGAWVFSWSYGFGSGESYVTEKVATNRNL